MTRLQTIPLLPTLLIADWCCTAAKPLLAAPTTAATPSCPPNGDRGQLPDWPWSYSCWKPGREQGSGS